MDIFCHLFIKYASASLRRVPPEALGARIGSHSSGHYSPEIYEQVKQELPSVLLATIYNKLGTSVEAGMLHEVSPLNNWQSDANPQRIGKACPEVEAIQHSNLI